LTTSPAAVSNQEIAEPLTRSPATGRTLVSRVMVKLGAHDRAQLVVVAYQTGLVSPGPPPFDDRSPVVTRPEGGGRFPQAYGGGLRMDNGLVRWAGQAPAASDDGSDTPMGNRATGPLVD
jgi:hypothetical protein